MRIWIIFVAQRVLCMPKANVHALSLKWHSHLKISHLLSATVSYRKRSKFSSYPYSHPPGVHPSQDGTEVAFHVSIMEWFMNFYGATKNWTKRPVECVCRGDFLQNGWWHLVINLEESIAITQNYVSKRNLLNVLDFLKRPNASELVSRTTDRVNLHDKFRSAIESYFPGTIDQLELKAEEKKAQEKKLTFWESEIDSKVGTFKFSF